MTSTGRSAGRPVLSAVRTLVRLRWRDDPSRNGLRPNTDVLCMDGSTLRLR